MFHTSHPIKIKSGFTLIEMLVALAIFGILSSFLLVNFRANSIGRNFKLEIDKISSALLTAQTMAQAGSLVNDELPSAYQMGIASCDSGCNYSLQAILSGLTKTIEQGVLDNVKITNQQPPTNLIVSFAPPRGDLSLAPPSNGEAKIELSSLQNSSLIYCLVINSVSGRIDTIKVNNSCDEIE